MNGPGRPARALLEKGADVHEDVVAPSLWTPYSGLAETMNELDSKDRPSRLPDWLVAVLVIEGTAFLIALVTPVTPSKTGSTWTPAELFSEDPGYVAEVLASFVMVNLIVAILGLLVWVAVRRERSKN